MSIVIGSVRWIVACRAVLDMLFSRISGEVVLEVFVPLEFESGLEVQGKSPLSHHVAHPPIEAKHVFGPKSRLTGWT